MNSINPFKVHNPVIIHGESPKPIQAEQEPIRICRDEYTPGQTEAPVLSRKDLSRLSGTGEYLGKPAPQPAEFSPCLPPLAINVGDYMHATSSGDGLYRPKVRIL